MRSPPVITKSGFSSLTFAMAALKPSVALNSGWTWISVKKANENPGFAAGVLLQEQERLAINKMQNNLINLAVFMGCISYQCFGYHVKFVQQKE